jgi:hypothetical protein
MGFDFASILNAELPSRMEGTIILGFASTMIWQEVYGNWILVPPRPIAVVHFLGGAFVATAPQLTYRSLLEFLAEQGYIVVATPFVNTFDHTTIANRAMRNFNLALEYLLNEVVRTRYLPVYGMGHSMGCKLHLLICSVFGQERVGNIFISFNNYPARRSIPLMEQLMQFRSQFVQMNPQFAQAFEMEFVPSPDETFDLIKQQYSVNRNLLIQFRTDEIDQTRLLLDVVQGRFPELTTLQLLNGNHLTPLGQDVKWQSGQEFSPLDAIAQFVRQEVYRDFDQLKRALLMWLDPLATLERR